MSLPTNSEVIYQIHLGRWQQASVLNHPNYVLARMFNLPWKNLLNQGFSCVYLLGVFDNRGPIVVNEEAGLDLTSTPNRFPSPFALGDHRQTNPLLGNVSDLRQLISSIHTVGLKVILDFVPNHRGLDHAWLKSRPNLCSKDHNGQIVREFSGDVFKLNYANQQLREEMLQTLLTIASWGADGVRVDMAHLIPLDFWSQAVDKVKSINPDFLFFAEAYPDNPFDLSIYSRLIGTGFDGIYHGVLFNNLEEIVSGHGNLENLANHLNFILGQNYASKLINYFANHDDFLNSLDIYLEAVLGLCLFLPGSSLIYNGTTHGLTHRLAHHYYQELADDQNELIVENNNVVKIFKLHQQYPQSIKSVFVDNGLLMCTTATVTLLLNLSTQTQKIAQNRQTPGLVHQLKSGDNLNPGKLEIFEN